MGVCGSISVQKICVQEICCGVCHRNDSACASWNFSSDGTVQCCCKSNGTPFLTISSLVKIEHDGRTFYTCPNQCGATLVLCFRQSDSVSFIDKQSRIKCINKRLTLNCYKCDSKGYKKELESQRFDTCQVCNGTGGVKCTAHCISTLTYRYDSYHDPKTITKTKTIACSKCGQDTTIGWIDQCISCNGAGQICHKTYKTDLCTCVNMSCRVFIDKNI